MATAFACGQHRLTVNRPLVEISYRPVGKLIYVPVQVNGSSPRWFVFDTGAPNSIIDSTLAENLDIRSISSSTIQGAGKGAVRADDAGEIQFTFGGLLTRIPHTKIVDLSKVPVPVKEDGLLGAEFLEQYVVRIDPVAHTLALYDPETFDYRGRGKSLPLELTNNRLYVQVGLGAKPGELVQRKLRVDTGSEDSIDDDTVRNSPATQKTTLGNGLGKSYEDVSGVYDTAMIGPFTFRHVWGPAGAIPIVGMEMMRRFTLTFDTRRGLLYLEPNSTFNEPVPAPS
jgi:Aspartyl protease